MKNRLKITITVTRLVWNQKSCYHGSETEMMDKRRIPPEVFLTLMYSVASDVWAYGLLVYELYNAGQKLYLGFTTKDMVDFVCALYSPYITSSTQQNFSSQAVYLCKPAFTLNFDR